MQPKNRTQIHAYKVYTHKPDSGAEIFTEQEV